jgi:hypothetical protein
MAYLQQHERPVVIEGKTSLPVAIYLRVSPMGKLRCLNRLPLCVEGNSGE